jgi:hypothetical protein
VESLDYLRMGHEPSMSVNETFDALFAGKERKAPALQGAVWLSVAKPMRSSDGGESTQHTVPCRLNEPGCGNVVSAICTPGVWPCRPIDQVPEQRVDVFSESASWICPL